LWRLKSSSTHLVQGVTSIAKEPSDRHKLTLIDIPSHFGLDKPSGLKPRIFVSLADTAPVWIELSEKDNKMENDDPTQSLPDRDLTTQPTATAILERLQGFEVRIFERVEQLGSALEGKISELRGEMNTRFAEVHAEMNTRFAEVHARFVEVDNRFLEIRSDMNTHFGLVANKIEVMHEDNLNVRASQRELLKRMGEIESKAS